MPGCTATVAHRGENESDPILHGLDDKPAWFDGTRAPRGGLAAEARAYAADLKLLGTVLGCKAPYPLLTEPNTLVAAQHDRPDLEGKPMQDVGCVERPHLHSLRRLARLRDQ